MKKTLSALIVLITFSLSGTGQDDFTKFRMGFKGDLNTSWLQPQEKDFVNEGAVFRAGFGFIADIHFTANYAFGTGLNIIRNGGEMSYFASDKVGDVDVIARVTRDYSIQYLQIPLTFKLRTNEIGYMTYFGQFGVGLGFNTKAVGSERLDYVYELVQEGMSISWEDSNIPSYTEDKENFTDDISLIRMSMIFSAGVEYNVSGSTSIVVAIFFDNGFTNSMSDTDAIETQQDVPVFEVNSDSGTVTPKTNKLKANSSTFGLTVGVLF
jgi:hypothetical protein